MSWRDLSGPALLRRLIEDAMKDPDSMHYRVQHTQEADGHFRGCARLGKCHCPANAPRDEWRPDDAT